MSRLQPRHWAGIAMLVAAVAIAAIVLAVTRPTDNASDAAAPPTAVETGPQDTGTPPEPSGASEPDETPEPHEPTDLASPGAGAAHEGAEAWSETVRDGIAQAGLTDPEALKPSDSITIKEDGEVVEDLLVRGVINIKADDVVIRNVRLETSTDAYALRVFDDYEGTLIENVEIAMPTDSCSNAGIYGGGGLTLRLSVITGCGDGLKVSGGSLYEYNDIRLSNVDGEGKHLDGMQNSGGSDVVIRGNYIDVPAEDGGNAAIFTHDYFSPVEDVLIEDNYLNGGNYTLFVEGPGTNGVRIVDNWFGRDNRYGLFRIRDAEVTREGNIWADNKDPV
jgi:hypothetical protein